MSLYDILRRRTRHGVAVAVIAVVVLGVMALPGLQQLVQDGEQYSGDHREDARSWFAANASPGLTVVVDSYSPWVDPSMFDVVPIPLVLDNDYVFTVVPDMVVLTQRGSGRFLRDEGRYPAQVERYGQLLNEYCVVQRFGGYGSVEFLSLDC